jgi:DMSO/TMAO reductase YedYZ molybdopterin-dependent catalytic subunit
MRTQAIRVSVIVACLLVVGNLGAQQSVTAPTVSATGDLLLTAPARGPLHLGTAELKSMAHITVVFHNSHTNADETYSGVRLSELLAKLGAPLGDGLRGKALAGYVVATGTDGYRSVLAMAEIDPGFHPGEVIVADAMDGKPLDAHNGPLKLVVTEDKRPARSVRNLVQIDWKMAD